MGPELEPASQKVFPLFAEFTAFARVELGAVQRGGRIQGRRVTEENLQEIRGLLAAYPDWHRT